MTTTSLSLYQIEDNLQALLDTEEGMENGNEQHLAILNEIAETSQTAIAKRDNLIHFLRHLDLQCASVDSEIDRLRKLKDSWKSGIKRLSKYVVNIIEEYAPEPKRGAKKLEGSIGVLSLRKKPDSVEVVDIGRVPLEYKSVTVTMPAFAWSELVRVALADRDADRIEERADKNAIKDALKAGREVPGCDLRYGENGLAVR